MTDDAETLAILDPDVTITLRDPDTGAAVEITVREFRMREGLDVQVIGAPLIRDLAVQVGDTAQEPDAVRTGAVLGAHADIWLRICAMASGQSVEWIGSLADTEAHALQSAVWQVNTGFFIRRLVAQALGQGVVETVSRSLASSSSLQPTGTEISEASPPH